MGFVDQERSRSQEIALQDDGYSQPNAQTANFAALSPEMNALIQETATALQIHPEDLATIISYETGGTMDPLQSGPTTKYGQHRGLIQFGEPQAADYGVDFSSSEAALRSQLGKDGAIVKYMLAHGFVPGKHNGLNAYATINAGGPNNLGAKDEAAGGAPGTVEQKWFEQMAPHRAKFTDTDWASNPSTDTGIPEEKGGDERTPQQKRADGWKYFADAMSRPPATNATQAITRGGVQNVEMLPLEHMAIPEF